jgi:DnaJ-domain-containing protein 1
MLDLGTTEHSVALINAALIALGAVLPGLILAFTRKSLAVLQSRPQLSLCKSETVERERAIALHETVCRRLRDVREQDTRDNRMWQVFFGCGADIRQPHADELDDLEAHAHHLRAAIVRLNRQPLERLRSWVRLVSSRFALGYALATHLVGFALLIVIFNLSKEIADDWMRELTDLWFSFPLERILAANAIAAGFAAMALPAFYLARRSSLRQEYRFEFSVLKDLAGAEPDETSDRPQFAHGYPHDPGSGLPYLDFDCFAILGLPDSATIDEIKEAYKALIKQNHPDRVHGMSPAFRRLAEAETKKLNAAYQEALSILAPVEVVQAAASNC